jgi:sirohydrochlorin ferrochelatase
MDVALVLCAHGARGTSAAADRHADSIRRHAIFREVRACCLKGRPSLAETMSTIGAERTYIAPLLMSRGHTWNTILPSALTACRKAPPRITIGQPVGHDPVVTEIIARRALATCHAQTWRPDETRALLVAHGTERDVQAREAAIEHVKRLQSTRIFADVSAAFLSDAPSLDEALAGVARAPCVVIGLFAETGAHGTDDVRNAILRSAQRIAYAGPIGDDPGFTEIIIRHALSAVGLRTAA